MALDEIRSLLRFKDSPGESCREVNALLDAHIEHVATRVRELLALEEQLKLLRKQCLEVESAKDCGILRVLSKASKSPRSSKPDKQHVSGTHR